MIISSWLYPSSLSKHLNAKTCCLCAKDKIYDVSQISNISIFALFYFDILIFSISDIFTFFYRYPDILQRLNQRGIKGLKKAGAFLSQIIIIKENNALSGKIFIYCFLSFRRVLIQPGERRISPVKQEESLAACRLINFLRGPKILSGSF